MILQYCLSVYAINFFTQPPFKTFKIRIINQQNGDCNQCKLLHSDNLTSHTFPIFIKIKGGERLLLKIKLINADQPSAQKDIGEGVISFDKNSIDDSVRVPLYDKKKGVEEVAICSLDLFLSGHLLEKKNAGTKDKSKSKIEDWRDRSQDAAFSQVSYTVQSQNETKERQNSQFQFDHPLQKHKQTQLDQRLSSRFMEKQTLSDKEKKHGGGNLQNLEALQKKSSKVEVGEKKLNQASQQSQPLINHPYLSGSQYKDNKQKFQESGSSDRLDTSFSPQKILEKIKQNEQMTEKLKKYLEKSSEKDKLGSKHVKHKYRCRTIKVEDYSSYISPKIYVNYHIDFKESLSKVIYDYKVEKYWKNELELQSENIEEVPIDKVIAYSSQNIKIVTFEALAYRSYCIINEVVEKYPKLRFPGNQASLKVKVWLDSYGNYEGKLAVQDGQNMKIDLSPTSKDQQILVLKSERFRFSFSISKRPEKDKIKETITEQETSFRQPEDMFHETDIKTRIKSLSMQPWGYGSSNLDSLTLNQSFTSEERRKSVALPKHKKYDKSGSSGYYSDESVVSPHQKIKIRPFETYSPDDSDQNVRLGLQGIKKTAKRQVPPSKQITLLRNGNRNNYRYPELKLNKKKYPHIKEMWQQLLLRKKVEEQQPSEEEELQATTKQQRDTVFSFKKDSSKRQNKIKGQGHKHKESYHNLYGCAAGSKKVVKVSERWPDKLYNQEEDPAPLRNFSLEVNNISITQPQAVIDEESRYSYGKFVRLSVKGRVTYFTEIIFNGGFNSILWKLSGCLFRDLFGSEKITFQVYETIQNRTNLMGKTLIRASKLYFLRNNHIYNGNFLLDGEVNGQFTLGFQVTEHFPFEVIREEEGEDSRIKESGFNEQKTKNVRGNSDFLTKKRELGQSRQLVNKSLEKKVREERQDRDLDGTLRRDRRKTQKSVKGVEKSPLFLGDVVKNVGYEQ